MSINESKDIAGIAQLLLNIHFSLRSLNEPQSFIDFITPYINDFNENDTF